MFERCRLPDDIILVMVPAEEYLTQCIEVDSIANAILKQSI